MCTDGSSWPDLDHRLPIARDPRSEPQGNLTKNARPADVTVTGAKSRKGQVRRGSSEARGRTRRQPSARHALMRFSGRLDPGKDCSFVSILEAHLETRRPPDRRVAVGSKVAPLRTARSQLAETGLLAMWVRISWPVVPWVDSFHVRVLVTRYSRSMQALSVTVALGPEGCVDRIASRTPSSAMRASARLMSAQRSGMLVRPRLPSRHCRRQRRTP